MMWQLASIMAAHVPTYTGCIDNCCTPPHVHTTSQAVYLQGSGGLEIHCDTTANDCPFNFADGELIDVDAVFRDAYDTTTFSLYVGCGGCVPFQDELVAQALTQVYYDDAVLEPFTQTSYRSGLSKARRTYNSSLLLGCAAHHFTIRAVDHANRTDGGVLVWSAVIGIGETFTVWELLSFPIYILRNHGIAWNGLWWTIIASGTAALVVWIVSIMARRPPPPSATRGHADTLFQLALVAYAATGVEMLIHLVYAQAQSAVTHTFAIGIAVAILSNAIPAAVLIVAWSSPTRACPVGHTITVLVTAIASLFLFGAGLFAGPLLAFLAGVTRHLKSCRSEKRAGVAPTHHDSDDSHETAVAQVMPSPVGKHNSPYMPSIQLYAVPVYMTTDNSDEYERAHAGTTIQIHAHPMVPTRC